MKLIFVMGEEEWEGLYINEKLVKEHNFLNANDILEILSKQKKSYEVVGEFGDYVDFWEIEEIIFYNVEQEWLDYQGKLPTKFNEIPQDKLKLISK